MVDKTDMVPLPLHQDTAPLKMTSHHMEEEVAEKAREAASLEELEAFSVEKKVATVEAAVDSLAASVEASLAERKTRVAGEEEAAAMVPQLPLLLDTAPLKMTSLLMGEAEAKEAKKVAASLEALEVIYEKEALKAMKI